MFRALLAPRSLPNRSREVPEVNRGVVRDEEGFAVYAFVGEGRGGQGGGVEECASGEQVCMRYVEDVGEVEEVLVGPQLETGFLRVVDVEYLGKYLDVTGSNDS